MSECLIPSFGEEEFFDYYKKLSKLEKFRMQAERRLEEVKYNLNRMNPPDKVSQDNTFFSRLEKVSMILVYFVTSITVVKEALFSWMGLVPSEGVMMLNWVLSGMVLSIITFGLLLIIPSIITFFDWLIRGGYRDTYWKWYEIVGNFLRSWAINPMSMAIAHFSNKKESKKYQETKDKYQIVFDKCQRLLSDLKRDDAKNLFDHISESTFEGMIAFPE